MVVAAPGDPLEVHSLTRALVNHPGPGFLRLGKAGEAILHDAVPSLEIGEVIEVRDGDDVILLSTGGMLEIALQVAARLRQQGVDVGVTSVPFLKPLDTAYITDAARRTALLCTLEEHSPIGGLGEAVAFCLAQLSGDCAALLPFSLPEGSTKGVSGDQHYLRARGGLDPDSIFAAVINALKGRMHNTHKGRLA